MSKAQQSKKQADTKSKSPEHFFIFSKQNYTLMLVGLAVIILGFILMYGKEDIYDFRKITLAPIVVLSGFVIEIFAIMKKPKSE